MQAQTELDDARERIEFALSAFSKRNVETAKIYAMLAIAEALVYIAERIANTKSKA